MTSFERRPKGRNNSRRSGEEIMDQDRLTIKLNEQGRSYNHQRIKFNGNASVI